MKSVPHLIGVNGAHAVYHVEKEHSRHNFLLY